jgi:hypothetical protein
MPALSDKEFIEARRELRDKFLRLTRWKMREVRRCWMGQRARRLPKAARLLKSLLAEMREAGLVPPPEPRPKRNRRRDR